jgi:hypothetical protein
MNQCVAEYESESESDRDCECEPGSDVDMDDGSSYKPATDTPQLASEEPRPRLTIRIPAEASRKRHFEESDAFEAQK